MKKEPLKSKELNFKSVVQLAKHFSNKQRCVAHLEKIRWNGQRCCVHCASIKTYVCKGFGKYKCGDCGLRFSVITKTFFENTKIPLQKWFIAMYLFASHKKGVSSCQLARDLDITQKSAWFMLHRIRQFTISKVNEMLSGIVEVDEAYIGGKEGNKHKHKKRTAKSKLYVNNRKHTIIGAIQRGGNIIAKFIPNANKNNVIPFINANIKLDSVIYTDEWYAYNQLSETFKKHDSVKHMDKQYVKGQTHTNTIENFWSVFKRTIYGTYHQVSPKHIQQYINESTFRFSTRKLTEQGRFDIALGNCEGRLKYSTLIAKV